MSTIEQHRPMMLPPLMAGQRLDQPTFHARYSAMPPETRAELVGGIVYIPSPMRDDHGETDHLIGGWLFHYQFMTPGVRGAAGATLKLQQMGEPQPDRQFFIAPEFGGQVAIDAEGYLIGAPDLVVEIARSSCAYDLGPKKADYERAKVREYIVVELDPDQVHWFVLRGGRYDKLEPGDDGIYRSEVFPGLWLDPVALYTNDPARLIHVLEQGRATPEHAAFVASLEERGRAKGVVPSDAQSRPNAVQDPSASKSVEIS